MSELTDDRLREIAAFARDAAVWGNDWRREVFQSNATPRLVEAICTELLSRRAAASTSTEGAGVKELEWRTPTDHPLDHDETSILVANGLGGRYHISERQSIGDPYLLWWAHDEFLWTGFQSIDEAKAAAQADYEARIRSALNPPAPKVTTDEAEERG